MGSIAAGDLTLLRARQDSQKTIESLYFWGFPEMWRGLVNDLAIERGEQTVAYDTGVLQGDFAFADLTEGLMVWFGSSAGADDLGRRLLLSITGTAASGSMVVDWYDDIGLSDGDHITIIHFRPPWPKLSWFSTADGFYKSGPPASEGGAGIVYSDQNTDPPPLPVIGRCGVAEPNSLWWLCDTVDASDCVAAWQAIGAYTQAESYINLNRPGTDDLTEVGVPSWSAAAGWGFTGAALYLRANITLGSAYTVIIRTLKSLNFVNSVLCGSSKANANFNFSYNNTSPSTFTFDGHWGDGSLQMFTPAGATVDRVFALAGNTAYVDGLLVGDVSGTFSVAAPSIFPIGAGHNGVIVTSFYSGNVYACAVYNRVLTGAEVSYISTQMLDRRWLLRLVCQPTLGHLSLQVGMQA
jgi:hypothetical protein